MPYNPYQQPIPQNPYGGSPYGGSTYGGDNKVIFEI